MSINVGNLNAIFDRSRSLFFSEVCLHVDSYVIFLRSNNTQLRPEAYFHIKILKITTKER